VEICKTCKRYIVDDYVYGRTIKYCSYNIYKELEMYLPESAKEEIKQIKKYRFFIDKSFKDCVKWEKKNEHKRGDIGPANKNGRKIQGQN